jgi:Asp-tRNA(Asn)/Glu-tRNA(Gln) amidotransferase C subunit
MDFLFHSVSEKEREQVKRQAKAIMDNFSQRLESVKDKIPEPFVERENFERQEGEGKNPDEDFRKRVFENAPSKRRDFILMEKKGW